MFKSILFCCSVLLSCGLIHAQIDLSKLHKAQANELDFSQPMMLDGISIPVCTMDGRQIGPDSLGYYLSSGALIPEPFVNDQKQIKALVLRKSSEDEKHMMMQMSAPMENPDLSNQSIPMDLPLRNLKNKEVHLSDFNPKKGKIIVINFWFIACKPCNMEMPELNKLVEKYKDADVEFLAIALDDPSQLKSFLKKTDFDYRVLSISQKDVAPLNISGYPTHLILNRDGQTVFKSMGYSPGSIEALEKAIEGELR
jgi:thiol-disulfide isomerase/thioredoxin